MPVCRQAQGLADWQAGWQGCQPGSRQACRPFRLQRKGAFSKVVSFCRCVAAFGVVVAACGVLYPALSPLILRLACGRYLAFSPFRCLYASVPAGRHKGKQTDRQAGELAGGQECLPVRKSENGQAGNYVFFTCVAAFGAVVAACGVFEPYFRLGKHPTFAPKRQGKAESAHRRPRLRPSFGQQKGIGRPMPYKWVMAGLSPIRLPRIFVSSKTQQGVL